MIIEYVSMNIEYRVIEDGFFHANRLGDSNRFSIFTADASYGMYVAISKSYIIFGRGFMKF